MENYYEGKVCVLTGGVDGIGHATAKAFRDKGCYVVCGDVKDDQADKVAGIGADYVHCDARKEEDLAKLFDYAVEKYGHVDFGVAVAGRPYPGTVENYEWDEFQDALQLMVAHPFFFCKYAVRQMQKQESGGAILLVASIGGLTGDPIQHCYATVKGAVVQLARSVGVTYGKQPNRITCNAIAPGLVHTDTVQKMIEADPSFLEFAVGRQPIPECVPVEDVAETICFLCGPNSRMTTGVIYPIDGGFFAL